MVGHRGQGRGLDVVFDALALERRDLAGEGDFEARSWELQIEFAKGDGEVVDLDVLAGEHELVGLSLEVNLDGLGCGARGAKLEDEFVRANQACGIASAAFSQAWVIAKREDAILEFLVLLGEVVVLISTLGEFGLQALGAPASRMRHDEEGQ